MSEFDKVKDEAEKQAREHPGQVSQGEQAISGKLGMNTDEADTSQHDQNTAPNNPDAGQPQGG